MASSSSSTVPPFAHSIVFKSGILRSKREIWNAAARTKNVSSSPPTRMLTHIHRLLLPYHLHLRPRSLQIRYRNLLSDPPLPPLLRPRSSPLAPPMSSLADSDPTNKKTVRVVVKGKVQGVFYRNWTVENATELGLKGWVRNRRDGSVEALLSGSADKVQEMEQRCRRGPPDAMVTGLELFPCSDDPGTRFERRSTV
ncbi:acylphosphatase [Sarracenia purpurea var. burkii]